LPLLRCGVWARIGDGNWFAAHYPQGLKGEEIPLAARIFAVVDVWDALISNRPYKELRGCGICGIVVGYVG